MPSGDTLEKLFGSQARVRLLRLFLLNPEEVFDTKTIVARLRLPSAAIAKEIRLLLDIGYIRRSLRVITSDKNSPRKLKRKKIPGYILVREFPYLNEIAMLLASHAPHAREKLLSGMRGAGQVNLVVIAGCLIGEDTLHVDAFIVGDSLKKAKIEKALKAMEAEIGKEIVYALMATKEFQYRHGMHDRFMKDLFDNPHEILLNKLGIQ